MGVYLAIEVNKHHQAKDKDKMNAYGITEQHPQAVIVRKVKTFAYGSHTVTREVDCDTCPKCGSENHKVVAGRGYYERVDLCRCECGQKFEVYG